MAITYIGGTTAVSVSAVTGISIPHTSDGTSNFHPIMVCFKDAARTVSNIYFSTFLSTLFPIPILGPIRRGDFTIYLYYLPGAPAGTLYITFSAGVPQVVAGIFDLSGASSSDPIFDAVGVDGNSNAPGLSIAGVAGSLLMDFLYMTDGTFLNPTPPITPTSGTPIVSLSPGDVEFRARTLAGSALSSIPMQWTANRAGEWVLAGIAIQPDSIPPPPTPTNQKQQMII